MSIYTVRTTVGRENIVIESIANKIETEGYKVKSLVHPEQIKGYIFAEGDLSEIQQVTQDIRHVRGLIEKEVPFEQVGRFLEEGKIQIDINVDDIVEIVGGPFKGEKGKVTRTNESKDEVTVELTEAAVPIPVTVNTEYIRVLESKEPEEEEAPSGE